MSADSQLPVEQGLSATVTPVTPRESAEDRAAKALRYLPEIGSNFLGFQLVTELGRGAFSRVFLARQAELGGRAVVLKISVDMYHESQVLSQLQHTNIVPIFSIHSAGPLQAVCMPHFGRTTLADVLQSLRQAPGLPDTGSGLTALLQRTVVREDLQDGHIAGDDSTTGVPLRKLQRLSYVSAVLWLGARLAEGLAHAHERGIVHRDLKPANILIGDDGQPMLLDFNLSENAERRARGSDSQLGGTLGYMAPEHLEAFLDGKRPVDARSDIYSLGVILFEMATGRLPFALASGPVADVLRKRLGDQRHVPGVRRLNRAVSPAVEAIIQHCLEPEPERRYQSAAELTEDLQRQLDNRPLRHVAEPSLTERCRKWVRRHPRLASPLSATALTAVLAAVGFAWLAHLASHEHHATRMYRDFQAALPDARALEDKLVFLQLHHGEDLPYPAELTELIERTKGVLAPYQVLEDAAWQDLPQAAHLPARDREALHREVGGLLYWLAGAYRIQGSTDKQDVGQLREALRLNELAMACAPRDQLPLSLLIQRAALTALVDEEQNGAELILKGTSPRGPDDVLRVAFEAAAAGEVQKALRLLDKSSVGPEPFAAHLLRAVCHQNLAEYDQDDPTKFEKAADCYSTCVALKSDCYEAHLRLGQARLQDWKRNNAQLARADAQTALRLRPDWPPAKVLEARATLQEVLARCDVRRTIDLDRKPQAELEAACKNWKKVGRETLPPFVLRGPPHLKELLNDCLVGLKLLPVEAEQPDPVTAARAALADFDKTLRVRPRLLAALYQKARILNNPLGRPEEALRVLDQIVRLYPDFLDARADRALLMAARGRRIEANGEGIRLVRVDPAPRRYYQKARIFAAAAPYHPLDRAPALRDLSYALENGYGWDRFQGDPYFLTPSVPLAVTASAGLITGLDGPLTATAALGTRWPMSLCDEAEFQCLVQIAPILGRGVPPHMRPPDTGAIDH